MSEKALSSSATQQVLPTMPEKPESPSLDAGGSASSHVGKHLRAAREARYMSVADVAQVLKLGVKQIEALESEDWSALPGNTMIRGFVRNYARLLNLDSDLLMQGLDAAQLKQTLQLDVSAGTSATLPQVTLRAQKRDYLYILAGLLLLVLAALAYVFLPADFWQGRLAALGGTKPLAVPAEASSPVTPPPAPLTPTVTPHSGESVTSVAAPNAAVLSDGGSLAARAPEPALPESATNGGGLKFTFAQAAWLEVRDGSGRVLVSQLIPAGSQREVQGQPPFELVVGNATEVTLEYQGRPIELAPRNKGVARLTVQ